MIRMILAAVAIVVAVVAAVSIGFGLFGSRANTTPVRMVSDVKYDVAYPARTELCVENGDTMRNWIFRDRWMKNQLSHDSYIVDGRTFTAFRIVMNDPKLPKRNVRFRKVVVSVGDGPTLEGHSYLRTLINGNTAKVERELLFVEFNGRLERQRRPLPFCGTPRS